MLIPINGLPLVAVRQSIRQHIKCNPRVVKWFIIKRSKSAMDSARHQYPQSNKWRRLVRHPQSRYHLPKLKILGIIRITLLPLHINPQRFSMFT